MLHIPGARSLKDRRRVVSSYKDRVRVRLSASVAEVGGGDSRQMASVGIALVARDPGEAEELLDRAVQAAHQLADAMVVDTSRRVLPWDTSWPEELGRGRPGPMNLRGTLGDDEDWDGED